VGIAPYRGRHATATGGEATAEIYRKAAEAGPSTSGLPSSGPSRLLRCVQVSPSGCMIPAALLCRVQMWLI
jgi:hypothetical protein